MKLSRFEFVVFFLSFFSIEGIGNVFTFMKDPH